MSTIINELLCFTEFCIVGADSINLTSIMNSISEFYSYTDIEKLSKLTTNLRNPNKSSKECSHIVYMMTDLFI